MSQNVFSNRSDDEDPLLLTGLAVEHLASDIYNHRLTVPLGLTGSYTVRAWGMSDARDWYYDDFAIALTPTDAAFDVLQLAAVTLHAMGVKAEFITLDINPDTRVIKMSMELIPFEEEPEAEEELDPTKAGE